MRLLSVSCLSLASKMKKTDLNLTDFQVLSKESVRFWSDYVHLKILYRFESIVLDFFPGAQRDEGFIFDSRTIRRMELIVLGALDWRMRSITPFSFLHFFLSFFSPAQAPLLHALKARASQTLFKAQNGTFPAIGKAIKVLFFISVDALLWLFFY